VPPIGLPEDEDDHYYGEESFAHVVRCA